MDRTQTLKMLTKAYVMTPEVKGGSRTARVRVVTQDDSVVFCAVKDDNLLASVGVTFEQLESVQSQLAMNGVYDLVLDALAEEMQEEWDNGGFSGRSQEDCY